MCEEIFFIILLESMPHTNSQIDQFCCMAAIIAAVVLLTMGFAEMTTFMRIQNSGTCGRASKLSNPKETAASAKYVHAGSEPTAKANSMVDAYEEWMNTKYDENAYKGMEQNEEELKKQFSWFANSEGYPEVEKHAFTPPSKEEILASHGQRPISLSTQMDSPTNSKSIGNITDIRSTLNPLPKPLIDCSGGVIFGGSDLYAEAVKEQIESSACKK